MTLETTGKATLTTKKILPARVTENNIHRKTIRNKHKLFNVETNTETKESDRSAKMLHFSSCNEIQAKNLMIIPITNWTKYYCLRQNTTCKRNREKRRWKKSERKECQK